MHIIIMFDPKSTPAAVRTRMQVLEKPSVMTLIIIIFLIPAEVTDVKNNSAQLFGKNEQTCCSIETNEL